MVDKTLSTTEISDLYHKRVRNHVVVAVKACLEASDNVYNRYELMQCMVIACFKDLATASTVFHPERTHTEFVRRWCANLIATYEAFERQQRTIDRLKEGK